ncbi:hypothetical protein BV898_15324 [Hypsibius exemplaris]|uniref:Uncharacterized protein n=1 Tax=Hypsibius exemplaris TaxID=2072580 RepID=A0A9X6NCR8_HYPEX|nr:hypothetical protein BV898_15324 [Hypsibius exemplaris]
MFAEDWLVCRKRDGTVVNGASLTDHMFQSIISDGGSPVVPQNMSNKVLHKLVTSCLRWNASARPKAQELLSQLNEQAEKNQLAEIAALWGIRLVRVTNTSSIDVRRMELLGPDGETAMYPLIAADEKVVQ